MIVFYFLPLVSILLLTYYVYIYRYAIRPIYPFSVAFSSSSSSSSPNTSSVSNPNHTKLISLGFLHPFARGGGGGERVLWSAIQAIQTKLAVQYPQFNLQIVLYNSEPASAFTHESVEKVLENFHLMPLQKPIYSVFIPNSLELRHQSKYCTMLMQGLSMLKWCWKCMIQPSTSAHVIMPSSLLTSSTSTVVTSTTDRIKCDLYIDTIGLAFGYPIIRAFNGPIMSYTHYPIISTDMLNALREVRPDNLQIVTASKSQSLSFAQIWKKRVKVYYYYFIAFLYGCVGRCVKISLVNGNWTRRHISSIWGGDVHVVYPPCNTASLQDIPMLQLPTWPPQLDESNSKAIRERVIVSIGQFRPEKDHSLLQLRAFSLFLKKLEPKYRSSVRLVLIGGARDDGDRKLVDNLKILAEKLDITSQVVFAVNAPFSDLQRWYAKASIGIHTMWNEHFGIGVVEMMAAGLVTIAHNSGGPKSDIITPHNGCKTGLLASTAEEYAEAMNYALCSSWTGSPDQLKCRIAARERALAFCDDNFENQFIDQLKPYLDSIKDH